MARNVHLQRVGGKKRSRLDIKNCPWKQKLLSDR